MVHRRWSDLGLGRLDGGYDEPHRVRASENPSTQALAAVSTVSSYLDVDGLVRGLLRLLDSCHAVLLYWAFRHSVPHGMCVEVTASVCEAGDYRKYWLETPLNLDSLSREQSDGHLWWHQNHNPKSPLSVVLLLRRSIR